MTQLSLYFGVDMPDLLWAGSLSDADVVLEPYHPLVQNGGFAEAFPLARRWVYVNPTTVDPWLLERTENPPPLLGRDQRWDLPRLDLSQPAGFDWAVQEALDALASDSGRCHGLFVDDLDRLLPDQAEIAMDYFVQLGLRGREPRWFVNRAFQLWPLIESLDAVLLEDITPHLIRYVPAHEVRWTREVVLSNIRRARERDVRIHSIGYRDQEAVVTGRAPDHRLAYELAALVDTVTTGADRKLAEWRTSQ